MELISPELALVDPDLAVYARSLLPAPKDCFAPFAPLARRRVAPRPSLTVALLALVAAALVGTPPASAAHAAVTAQPTAAAAR